MCEGTAHLKFETVPPHTTPVKPMNVKNYPILSWLPGDHVSEFSGYPNVEIFMRRLIGGLLGLSVPVELGKKSCLAVC